MAFSSSSFFRFGGLPKKGAPAQETPPPPLLCMPLWRTYFPRLSIQRLKLANVSSSHPALRISSSTEDHCEELALDTLDRTIGGTFLIPNIRER